MIKPRAPKINLVKIAEDIKASGKDYEEAIKEYYLNPQQVSRVREKLGIKIRTGMTQKELYDRSEADLAAAIERAKKNTRRPKATKVVYGGKEYYDVTPLFIDYGG